MMYKNDVHDTNFFIIENYDVSLKLKIYISKTSIMKFGQFLHMALRTFCDSLIY